MLGSKRKSNWMVVCKACGRPFPTGLDRETREDIPSSTAYQCTQCGMTESYSAEEHHPAA